MYVCMYVRMYAGYKYDRSVSAHLPVSNGSPPVTLHSFLHSLAARDLGFSVGPRTLKLRAQPAKQSREVRLSQKCQYH
jgi:hypothetical protein